MKNVKFLSLFLPLILSYFLKSDPINSYIAAWVGSFVLFILSLSGFIAPLPDDLTFAQQLMRPVIIIQIVFCGFNFCTSIFYFLDTLGMQDFKWRPNYYVDMKKISQIAGAQRYYLLGHISLLLGMFSRSINKQKLKYKVREDINWSVFLAGFTSLVFVVAFVTRYLAGLTQISQQLTNLCFLSGTYAICYAIIKKDRNLIFLSSIFYAYNFFNTLVSGFKEPIIISILLLCVFMYPYYKIAVTFLVIPLIYVCFFVVPIYVTAFRQATFSEDNAKSTEQIRDDALNQAVNNTESNWDFLTGRLSEIGMFTKYIESTPKLVPYYGFDLVGQSLLVLVPRIVWQDKPATEVLVMKRVYDAGVVSNIAKVSAKPMYIVDGYLSGGFVGVMISLFIYGFALQYICGVAESWFGGYFLGTAIVFNGLFPIFWRGLSFEFILNTVLYSMLTMWVLHRLLYTYDFLEKIYDDSPDSAFV